MSWVRGSPVLFGDEGVVGGEDEVDVWVRALQELWWKWQDPSEGPVGGYGEMAEQLALIGYLKMERKFLGFCGKDSCFEGEFVGRVLFEYPEVGLRAYPPVRGACGDHVGWVEDAAGGPTE